MLGQRFSDALILAHELHARQTRKASSVPYVSHVLAVAALVLEYGGDEDTAIAALLHDSVEDCGGQATARIIGERFGERVLGIVLGCSDTDECPKPPWAERKQRYLAHLPNASPDVHLVSAADKLHNLISLVRDHRQRGDELWSHFRSGRDGALWYYGELIGIFNQTELPRNLVEELDGQYRLLVERCSLTP